MKHKPTYIFVLLLYEFSCRNSRNILSNKKETDEFKFTKGDKDCKIVLLLLPIS